MADMCHAVKFLTAVSHARAHNAAFTAKQFKMLRIHQTVLKFLYRFAEIHAAIGYHDISFDKVIILVRCLQQSPADGENGAFACNRFIEGGRFNSFCGNPEFLEQFS